MKHSSHFDDFLCENKKDFQIKKIDLRKTIDHTVLKPDTTKSVVERFCKEAVEWGFASVCINPIFVKYAAALLKDTEVKICTVIGFPLGAQTSAIKAAEAGEAIENGAQELDMVMNIGALKEGDYSIVLEDIKSVVDIAHSNDCIVKVIIETCLLSKSEKEKACSLAKEAGAHFVKTSTGMSTGGATAEDIMLMKKVVGRDMQVKASTGINNYKIAMEMIKAGATRLGTSKGIIICKEAFLQEKNCTEFGKQ